MVSQQDIINSYLSTYENKNDKLRFDAMVKGLLLAAKSSALSPIKHYLDFINNLDDLGLRYLCLHHSLELKRKLYLTYLLLLEEGKHPQELQACGQLIDNLYFYEEDQTGIRFNEAQCGVDGKPLKYLGLPTGQWFGKRVIDVLDSSASTTVEYMSEVNNHRLYWVWGGGLLRTVISLLPDTFDTANAQAVATAPSQFTGYMSWILYYARFSLNLFLLLKNTFADELTEEEKKSTTPYWDRFKTQWKFRKYALLNDFIWGIANMVCFLWCTGSDGDLLTIGLLCFDTFMAFYEYAEEQCAYAAKFEAFAKEISELEDKLALSKNDKDLLEQLRKKIQAEKRCRQEWEHKQIGLLAGSTYALSLLIAFTLATLPFLPIAAPTLMILTTVGVVLCFALTVINNGIKMGLEIRSDYLTQSQIKEDYLQKITEFNDMMTANPDLNDPLKIFLYLQIKQLRGDEDYQQDLAVYHTLCTVRSMTMQILIPGLMLSTFMVFPLGAGLLVLAGFLAIALITHLVIENLCKPEKITYEFDNQEYEEFSQDPDKWVSKPVMNSNSLFAQSRIPARDGDLGIPDLGLKA